MTKLNEIESSLIGLECDDIENISKRSDVINKAINDPEPALHIFFNPKDIEILKKLFYSNNIDHAIVRSFDGD